MTGFPDPERWRALDALLEGALDRPAAERASYLREATGGDRALYRETLALLERVAAAERVIGESAAEHAGPLLSSLEADFAPADASPREGGGAWGEAATAPAESIGPYRIEEEIGRGGMGVVYRAVDERLGRWVALKFLPPAFGRDPEAKRRLIAEARAASATEHPNVGSLYEIGETEDGRSYLVLACYEGETLKERIARGPLPADEAVEVASQIAAGLAAAHGKGVVHRDIKPGNVFLTADGWVKILDFGVATLAEPSRKREPGAREMGARAAGEPAGVRGAPAAPTRNRFGTVAYMSPEQIRAEGVDARTDLWSLGVVLHEMLTGERPFRGDGDDAVIRAILSEEPGDAAGRVPARLQPVLARALSKDPAERFESAEAFGRALGAARVLDFARAPERSRRRVRLASAAAVAVLGVAAAWIALPELRPGAAGLAADGAAAEREAEREAAALAGAAPESAALLRQATDYLRRYRREDNEVALDLLTRAIEADPTFALAHARLGTARALKVFQYGDGYEWADSALASARRAVALAPDLAEAHHALGMAYLAWERYEEALASFGRATALDPEYWAAANLTGIVRWRLGDYDEAVRWYGRALELGPAGTANLASTLSTMGGAHAFLGQWERADDAVARALALQPDLPLAHHNAVLLALVEGRDADAVDHGRILITINPGNARAWATAGTAYQFAGARDRARAHFERAYELSPTGFDLLWRSAAVLLARELWEAGEPERARARALLEEYEAFARERLETGNESPFVRSNLAAVHALRGDREGALRWLEEAAARGRKEHGFLARDPLFESLREDARFQRILAANRAEMERQRGRVEREEW